MFAALHTQGHRDVLVGTLVVDGYTWMCGMHVCTGAVRSSVAGTKEPAHAHFLTVSPMMPESS